MSLLQHFWCSKHCTISPSNENISIEDYAQAFVTMEANCLQCCFLHGGNQARARTPTAFTKKTCLLERNLPGPDIDYSLGARDGYQAKTLAVPESIGTAEGSECVLVARSQRR